MRSNKARMKQITESVMAIGISETARKLMTIEGGAKADYSFKENMKTCRQAIRRILKKTMPIKGGPATWRKFGNWKEFEAHEKAKGKKWTGLIGTLYLLPVLCAVPFALAYTLIAMYLVLLYFLG